ncbi:histone-lysine N-methyltransferase PRDM9-like [Odontomachus brunneus]|uniref:histone-lysine N-methyltransferase PRDM9-like n=1 Tax=Odontomachus brunneus TaxID=486640 RepID=UPI0013F2A0A8|nr:histone-lysine N-methyltransferase PRDM9-like [Odontomachus brunneus]
MASSRLPSRKSFICRLCGKSYVWRVSLCRHLREECGKEPQHRCDYCGKIHRFCNSRYNHQGITTPRFEKRKSSEAFVKPRRVPPAFFSAALCRASSLDKASFLTYLLLTYRFQCTLRCRRGHGGIIARLNSTTLVEDPTCEASTARRACGRHSQKRRLLPPSQDCLPKPFACHKCDKTYKNKGSLQRHLNDECHKPPQYICEMCRRGFKQKANFKRHAFTIHGISSFVDSRPRENRVTIRLKSQNPQ